jgi:hypothetical protein
VQPPVAVLRVFQLAIAISVANGAIRPKATADLIVMHGRRLLQSRQELFLGEHEVDTPGHGKRRVVARRLPVCDENGEPKYLLSLIDDLTNRGTPG